MKTWASLCLGFLLLEQNDSLFLKIMTQKTLTNVYNKNKVQI